MKQQVNEIMTSSTGSFCELLRGNKIVPVVTVDSKKQACDLTQALYAGGISVIEITLRTDAALESIQEVKSACPDVIVLAGTVTSAKEMQLVQKAGADGAISPAFSTDLLKSAEDLGMPFLPGVATPSEVLAGMELGVSEFKLFPAAAVGGVTLLKSLSGPLPQAKFCPTGGLNIDNFKNYLELPNVMCVGGSWMAPKQAVNEGQWEQITDLAKRSIAAIES